MRKGSLRNVGAQQRALMREVPFLLRVLWVWHGHRLWPLVCTWDLAAAGTMYIRKMFSSRNYRIDWNQKTLHGSCRPEQQPCLKDTCLHLDKPPLE